MEFICKKIYKKDVLMEKYYIDDQEVDSWTFETLDSDAFEKLKNINIPKKTYKLNLKKPDNKPLSESVMEPEEYRESLKEIVNNIKIFKTDEAVQFLIALLDSVGDESYKSGYVDSLLNIKDDLSLAVSQLLKKSTRRRRM
jgi:hypothetical protein